MLALLLLPVWFGLLQYRTPSPAPIGADVTTFSADRAMLHLQAIATESRAVGTPGHAVAQVYLMEQLTSMGLAPELWTAPSVVRFEGSDAFETAIVTNVIARIPGTDNTGAIALNAHYDSGDTGPGASDCGSCVVTVLESVRAILAGPALRNDVIIVFSDAEEHGDLGASAFNVAHPWADDVRLALNYEAQGTGGPALLYATSDNNGWLVGEFLKVAPHPSAYSLFPQIVRLFPEQRLACDLQDYLNNGAAGLGFVYAGDPARYHTTGDSIANIDRGSLQQEGAYTVALVNHFGNGDFAALQSTPDRVFFNVWPGRVLWYPGWLVAPLAGVITLVFAAVTLVARHRGLLSFRGTVVGSGLFALGVALATVITAAAWLGIRSIHEPFQAILVGNYALNEAVVALSLLSLATMAAFFAPLRRAIRPADAIAGALLVWTLPLWLISLAAPGISYVVAWPLLFGLIPLAWVTFAGEGSARPWARVAVLALAAVPALLLLPMTAYQVVALIIRIDLAANMTGSISILGLWAFFVAPIAGLLIAHLHLFAGESDGRRRWLAPAGLMIAAALAFVWAGANARFSDEQPRPSHIAYELDTNTGSARLVSIDESLDSFTGTLLAADSRTGQFGLTPAISAPAFQRTVAAVSLPKPEVIVQRQSVSGDLRALELLLTSPRGAPLLDIVIHAPGEIVAASVHGVALDLSDYRWARDGELTLMASNVTSDGVLVSLRVQGSGPIEVELSDMSYGLPVLPGVAIPARPSDSMPVPGLPRDATIVRATIEV